MNGAGNDKKPIASRLMAYGFKKATNVFTYEIKILKGEFSLKAQIAENGELTTSLFEVATQEEYRLHKTPAKGTFVGKVRESVREIENDIISKCYESVEPGISSRQGQMVARFVEREFREKPERLWPKTPSSAIIRNAKNGKWYLVFQTVEREKLGIEGNGEVEIINLRMKPMDGRSVLGRPGHYPGWHMNKQSWFSIILDGTVSDEEIRRLIRESRLLSGQ